jgi:hypothetical protein
MALMKLRKLGENESGENAGIAIPRDELRLAGLMNEEGELLERPHLEFRRVDEGTWELRRLDD